MVSVQSFQFKGLKQDCITQMCNAVSFSKKQCGPVFLTTDLNPNCVCVCVCVSQMPGLSLPWCSNSQSVTLAATLWRNLHHPHGLARPSTVCMHLRPHPGAIHTVLSYSSAGNDNELMINVGYEGGPLDRQ